MEKIALFRRLVKLNDGQNVLLRPLVAEDRENLVALFRTASDEDRRFLRHDVHDAELVRSWVDGLDYNRVLPLVAEAGGRLVGEATLHFGRRSTRHIGEVRIYLEPAYRGKGLGSQMLKELIGLARQSGLLYLLAQVVLDQTDVIRAFQNLGFRMEASIRDYFMTEDGRTHNVVLLMLPLQQEARYEF
jgi:L-amino acid N-acyltransferase YncA